MPRIICRGVLCPCSELDGGRRKRVFFFKKSREKITRISSRLKYVGIFLSPAFLDMYEVNDASRMERFAEHKNLAISWIIDCSRISV